MPNDRISIAGLLPVLFPLNFLLLHNRLLLVLYPILEVRQLDGRFLVLSLSIVAHDRPLLALPRSRYRIESTLDQILDPATRDEGDHRSEI